MRITSWNCRGLGGFWTIPQVKEMVHDRSPDLVFSSETKQTRYFVDAFLKKMFYNYMYVVDPVGLAGGLVVFWNDSSMILSVCSSECSIQMQMRDGDGDVWWYICVHISCDVRSSQFDYLV
ncbi:hypothetical protein ACH5RR_036391 [Cinchona calisaya]|uniref:Endonuclease/exonuclease/phosphatase domain-containing protein n=1 Tax=Cinchona calisaya TaxID=153742 RepID=A0ABD2Y322_9GENT